MERALKHSSISHIFASSDTYSGSTVEQIRSMDLKFCHTVILINAYIQDTERLGVCSRILSFMLS